MRCVACGVWYSFSRARLHFETNNTTIMVAIISVNGTEVDTYAFRVAYDRVFMPDEGPNWVQVLFYAQTRYRLTQMTLFLYNTRTGERARMPPRAATISACDYSRRIFPLDDDIALGAHVQTTTYGDASAGTAATPDELRGDLAVPKLPGLIDTWHRQQVMMDSYEKFTRCSARFALDVECHCQYLMGPPTRYCIPRRFVTDGYRLTVSLGYDSFPGIEPSYRIGYRYGTDAYDDGSRYDALAAAAAAASSSSVGNATAAAHNVVSSSSSGSNNANANANADTNAANASRNFDGDGPLRVARRMGYYYLAALDDDQTDEQTLPERVDIFIRAHAVYFMPDNVAFVRPPQANLAGEHITLERATTVSRVLAGRHFSGNELIQKALLQSLTAPKVTYASSADELAGIGPSEITRRAHLIRAFERFWNRTFGLPTRTIRGERYDDGTQPTDDNRYTMSFAPTIWVWNPATDHGNLRSIVTPLREERTE